MDHQKSGGGSKSPESTFIWKDRKHFMWFPWSFTKYSLDQDRLYEDRGLLNTKHDEVLLYRIVDITMTRTLGQKIFGTGTIVLCTKVDTSKDVKLINIKNCRNVNRMLSDMIEQARSKKRVVGKEFYGSGGHAHDDGYGYDEGGGDADEDLTL